MKEVKEKYSLKKYNTFGVDVNAKFFCIVKSEEELKAVLQTDKYAKCKRLILGGGSNILFTKDFEGLVIKNEIDGIEITEEDEDYVYIKVGSGLAWEKFINFTLINNFWGVENLTDIPGTVGASPVQNIGAYGTELKDVFHSCEVIFLEDFSKKIFFNNQCEFSYRNSIFKSFYKDKIFILSVTFKLSKKAKRNFSYKALLEKFINLEEEKINIKLISKTVSEIRKSKLPDVFEFGSAGSFFKNPEVSRKSFDELKNKFNDIAAYKIGEDNFKIAAGWLIEKCGFKGIRKGNTGTYPKQALVIVNYNNATGNEIWEFAQEIQNEVNKKFNIKLIPEVNII